MQFFCVKAVDVAILFKLNWLLGVEGAGGRVCVCVPKGPKQRQTHVCGKNKWRTEVEVKSQMRNLRAR